MFNDSLQAVKDAIVKKHNENPGINTENDDYDDESLISESSMPEEDIQFDDIDRYIDDNSFEYPSPGEGRNGSSMASILMNNREGTL